MGIRINLAQVKDDLRSLKGDVADGFGDRAINDLKLIRSSVFENMNEIMDEARSKGRDLRSSEARQYDELETVLNEASTLLDKAEAQERSLTRNTLGGFQADWQRDETREVESPKEVRQAFETYLRTGSDAEIRAQGVTTDAAGGYTVPTTTRKKIIEAISTFSPVERWAEVIETTTGEDLKLPKNDDTGNEGAILQENVQITEQDMVFSEVTMGAFMYTSKLVRVSFQLLQDNVVDLESYLARKLGERVARVQARHFTVGTGSNQPDGFQPDATVGVTGATGQTDSVTYDDLVDLVSSIDEGYLDDSAAWHMNRNTLATIRKIKDSAGRPLVQPDLRTGAPNSLLGFPIQVNPFIPDMAANAKAIIFGSLRQGYAIRRVRNLSLLHFKERYLDYLQHGFAVYNRADGQVTNASAFKAYQNSAT